MRSFSLLAFYCFSALSSLAQVGNEWINFSQSYYKIPVGSDGIYRLTYNDLQAAGVPVGTIDPTKIQIFHRGVEQSILVTGEGDLAFNGTDFIEFYGQQNDGTLDAELYKPATAQPHRYYNLYSDTTCYFLTFGGINGKRMASFSESNTGGLPAQTYHIAQNLMLFTNEYAGGVDLSDEVFNAFYDVGEGWTSGKIFQGQQVEYTLTDISRTATDAPAPELEVMIVGRGAMAHHVEIYGGTSMSLLAALNFSGFEPQKVKVPIPWSDITVDGKLSVRVRVTGASGSDRVSVCYLKLDYPQRTDAQNSASKSLNLIANGGGKSFLQIQNPSPGMRLFDVTSPSAVRMIGTSSTTTLDAIVADTQTPRKLFVTSTPLTPAIKKVSFRSMAADEHDYLIIAHRLLRGPALGYSDPVKAYAEYRASSAGGSYDTLVVNIDQLYDQFSYGETTPVAIFRFLKLFAEQGSPRYLLLIGKGLDVWYKYNRNPSGNLPFRDLIPPPGYPSSDMAYTAGLSGTTFEPAIPTGRIPAMEPAEVAAYLNKVKETEALPYDDLWRKNVLHLSGGREEGEPELLRDYLVDLQSAAEGYHLGGKVSALAKYSKEVQTVNVSKQVNAGVNLITFFGHSSASNLDFDIGYVSDAIMGYNNKGKYPTLLMNGCNVGSYFLTYKTFGEDWVLARDKGAAAFIAHSSYGFTSLLKRYSDYFYEVGYQDSTFIYQGIGDIQKEVARRYMLTASPTIEHVTQVQQMVLIGDPAIKLFGARKADLEINANNVSIHSLDGQPITALTPAFALKMIVRNFGQAKKDTIRIEVERTMSDNSVIVYDSLYPAPMYSDTLMFIVQKGNEEGFGTNGFKISIDPDNILPELTKANNTVSRDFVIPLNGTRNLYPSDFSIVNTPEVSLAFQTTDLLSDERNFILQMDTLNTFDSPYLKEVSVKGTVLARYKLTLLEEDTLAYYWRTKLADPLPAESQEWATSSFTFIDNGPEGWAQVHFTQYMQNTSEGMVMNPTLRQIGFKETTTDVDIMTFGSNHAASSTDVSIKINDEEFNLTQQGFICRDNSLGLIAFDKYSAAPYIGVKFKWYNRGNRACGREPWVINNYVPWDMVTGDGFDLIQFVDNIADGDTVVLFSIGDAQYSAWPAAAKTKLGELGISVAQIDGLQPGEPVVIYGKKGLPPGQAHFYKTGSATPDIAELVVDKAVTGRYSKATMTSGRIGPAMHWESLSSRQLNVEPTDHVEFDIVGVSIDGEEQLLLAGVTDNVDLAFIDAQQFPYIKIVFKVTDDVNLSPAQLDYWLVSYTPVPEGLLTYHGPKGQQRKTEGEIWEGDYRFINISNRAFTDSLTVRYEVFNQDLHTAQTELLKIKPPQPGDTTHFLLKVNTIGKAGVNDISVFVNPRVLPEQYYDNNLLQLRDYLLVEEENIHPVLDVSFDGRYIQNREFVSSNPLIAVKVWDQNKHIYKADTTGMKIFITYPCATGGCEPTAISLKSSDVTWFVATESSPFTIEFRPKSLADGIYNLRVEAQDAKGNASGSEAYQVAFTVMNETTVTISEPYPNPSSRDVYFKIVITGNNVPEAFDLKIISANGAPVAHFGDYQDPNLHIGINELNWNGTDQHGNRLPGGVYIYKLMLYIQDRLVQKVGKVVLVR